jgi:hypothetical protein
VDERAGKIAAVEAQACKDRAMAKAASAANVIEKSATAAKPASAESIPKTKLEQPPNLEVSQKTERRVDSALVQPVGVGKQHQMQSQDQDFTRNVAISSEQQQSATESLDLNSKVHTKEASVDSDNKKQVDNALQYDPAEQDENRGDSSDTLMPRKLSLVMPPRSQTEGSENKNSHRFNSLQGHSRSLGHWQANSDAAMAVPRRRRRTPSPALLPPCSIFTDLVDDLLSIGMQQSDAQQAVEQGCTSIEEAIDYILQQQADTMAMHVVRHRMKQT